MKGAGTYSVIWGPASGQYRPRFCPFTKATPLPQPVVFRYVSIGRPDTVKLPRRNTGPLRRVPLATEIGGRKRIGVMSSIRNPNILHGPRGMLLRVTAVIPCLKRRRNKRERYRFWHFWFLEIPRLTKAPWRREGRFRNSVDLDSRPAASRSARKAPLCSCRICSWCDSRFQSSCCPRRPELCREPARVESQGPNN